MDFGALLSQSSQPHDRPFSERAASSISKDISFSFDEQNIFSKDQITEKCEKCDGTATFTMTSGAVKLLNGFKSIISSFGSNLSLSDFADIATVNISVSNLAATFEFETEVDAEAEFSVPLLGSPIALDGLEVRVSSILKMKSC